MSLQLKCNSCQTASHALSQRYNTTSFSLHLYLLLFLQNFASAVVLIGVVLNCKVTGWPSTQPEMQLKVHLPCSYTPTTSFFSSRVNNNSDWQLCTDLHCCGVQAQFVSLLMIFSDFHNGCEGEAGAGHGWHKARLTPSTSCPTPPHLETHPDKA